MSICIKAILIISSIVALITASSMGISIYYQRLNLVKTIEGDMMAVRQIAENLVSIHLELWKTEADMTTAVLMETMHNPLSSENEVVSETETMGSINFFAGLRTGRTGSGI
ncbi:MAG: hypothetical protein LBD93_04955 [Treponema sp.]|jgi:hypothetical protein|nr:hypothetical protein [Treponema sp.]